jgi:hypothetical protein
MFNISQLFINICKRLWTCWDIKFSIKLNYAILIYNWLYFSPSNFEQIGQVRLLRSKSAKLSYLICHMIMWHQIFVNIWMNMWICGFFSLPLAPYVWFRLLFAPFCTMLFHFAQFCWIWLLFFFTSWHNLKQLDATWNNLT